MKSKLFPFLFCILVLFLGQSFQSSTVAQELVEAPAGYVQYKLSNVRTENSVYGKIVLVDYKRTKEGRGSVQLAVRTDEGRMGVVGFSRIEESGTIRLRDQLHGLGRMLGREDEGMEFFFVADGLPYGMSSGLYSRDSVEYLVSNTVQRGKMNSKVSARALSKKEKAEVERQRKASLPPETVPAGYTRGTRRTELVPGAPIKVGSGGKWADGTVVSLPTSTTVRVLQDGRSYIRKVSRDKWIAVSDKVAKEIRSNPGQFKSDVRTLKDGNLALGDDVQPVTEAMSLLKGTPLLVEKYSRWHDVFFLSADNKSVRVVSERASRQQIEFFPIEKLAVRNQTLVELKKDGAEQRFAENVVNYESKMAGLAGFPGRDTKPVQSPRTRSARSRSRASRGSLDSSGTGPGFGKKTAPKYAKEEQEEATNPVRTWTDSTGKFKIEASMVEKTDKSITLKRSSGKIAEIPLEKLSEADLAYLKKLEEEAANPFADLADDSSQEANPFEMKEPSNKLDYRSPFELVSKFGDLGWGPASIAISPDNALVVIGRKGSEVSLGRIESGQILIDSGRMDHMGNVTAAKFTADGKHLVIGGSKGVIEVYSVGEKGRLELLKQFGAHSDEVTCIAFSPDGKHALSGSKDKQARYWEVETGRQVTEITGFDGAVKTTCIRPSDGMLLASDGETLVVFDVDANKAERTLKVGRSSVQGQSAAISPNGLVYAGGNGYDIELWNLEEYLKMPKMEGTSIPWSMVFSPDNEHLFSGHNGVVEVWSTKTQNRLISHAVGKSSYVQSIATNADGSLVACASGFKEVTVIKAAPAR